MLHHFFRPFYFFVSLVVFGFSGVWAQSDTASLHFPDPWNIKSHFQDYDQTLSDRWLKNYEPIELFEVYGDNVHYQLEAASNYALPDDVTMSMIGGSYLWNDYTLEGFSFQSMLTPGSPLHRLKMFRHSMRLTDETSTVEFTVADEKPKTSILSLRSTFGGLGDRIFFANDFINELMGHPSPHDRQIRSLDQRRRTTHAFSLYSETHFENSPLTTSIWSFDNGSRTHNEFDEGGIIGEFDERYIAINGQLHLELEDSKWADKVYVLSSFATKNKWMGELNVNENETGKQETIALTAFAEKKIDNALYTYGINYGYRNQFTDRDTIYKNAYDVDGETLYPWIDDQQAHELQLLGNANWELSKNWSAYAQTNQSFAFIAPKNTTNQYFSYFQPYQETGVSLFSYAPQTSKNTVWQTSNRLGIRHQVQNHTWTHDYGASLHAAGIYGANTSTGSGSIDFHSHSTLKLSKSTRIGFLVGKHSYKHNMHLYETADESIRGGKYYYWNDQNGDLRFQSGEQGDIMEARSGISINNGLKLQTAWYVEMPLEHYTNHNGREHHFSLVPQFRSFRNTPYITYKGDATDYGYFNGDGAFIQDQAPEYEISNYPEDIFAKQGGDNWLFNQPFYGGVTGRYSFRKQRFFTSVSFTFYMALGQGSAGNGLHAMSLGRLDPSTANPNADINGLGRQHSDRSIVVRYLVGQEINDRWSYAITVKYKDGESFSNLVWDVDQRRAGDGNVLALWNYDVAGDNPFTTNRGYREDAYYSVDTRLEYKTQINNHPLRFQLNVYNLIDFGLEITEYQLKPHTEADLGFVNSNSRAPLEVQIPRTIEFGIIYGL